MKELKKNKYCAESKVFVAMSGGVDSSVAAALLKQQGYQVIGCHIRCFNLDGCGEKDAEDARRVAEQLGVPFYVFDLEKEYKEKVVKYMIDGYRQGLTPNPDVMCNKEIKFGLFLEKALSLGADFVATGHYVRLEKKNNKFYKLKIAKDPNKDQSYFLWTLNQNQLKHCLFPIGDYPKKKVRLMAKKFGLLTADKKDSQGICFLGKVTLTDFLKQYLPEKKGSILSVSGKEIGKHRGVHFYTIGQRHGFQIKKLKNENQTKPFYIANKDVANNTLVVVEGNDKALYKDHIKIINANFTNSQLKIKKPLKILACVRYRQPLTKATLIKKGGDWQIIFKKPQKFVASGQSAVFYTNKKELIGGGVIANC